MVFNYRIHSAPSMVLNKVCALAQDKLMVSGSDRKGWFTGAFEGTYSVEGSEASIVITRKPMFVSWSLVDQGLKYLVS
jgi:hypothetical protein